MLTEAVYYITREFTSGMANVKVIPLTGIPMFPVGNVIVRKPVE